MRVSSDLFKSLRGRCHLDVCPIWCHQNPGVFAQRGLGSYAGIGSAGDPNLIDMARQKNVSKFYAKFRAHQDV